MSSQALVREQHDRRRSASSCMPARRLSDPAARGRTASRWSISTTRPRSQMPQPVIDRLVRYQTTQHANIHRGVHYLSETATAAYEEARRKIQRFINAREDREVIFTSGTTDAINLVMHGYGRNFIEAGDEIILSTLEHHSNIVPWQMLREEKGARCA